MIRFLSVTALPAALVLGFASLVPTVAAGDPLRWAVPWIPQLGVSFSFLVDGLGLLFALLISGIGLVVMAYASAYMTGYAQTERFFIILTLFMLSMLGAVLADNLITLFVFWELTTLTSFLLIGFTHEKTDSRAAALQALLVTGLGGLAMLAGFVLLGSVAGTFELSEIRSGTVDVRTHGLYGAILTLVLLGCFTKSAQFPFHFWLPNAMAAPTPVSAYLHSATMVKLGIYLMARLHPTLGGTEGWTITLTVVGAITAVLSSIWSLNRRDLKQVLAYTTVMGLGTLTFLLGLGSVEAAAAAVLFLIVHCFYKATLFLVVGAVDHAVHTRDREALSGLWRTMPITFLIAVGAALSMAGLPPFVGFLGKELAYEAGLHAHWAPGFVVLAALVANAMMVAAAGLVALRPFLGPAKTWDHHPHDPPVVMWLGPMALAILGLLCGLFPAPLAKLIVGPATSAVWGEPETIKLYLWHGFNLPLALSVVTLALGAALFVYGDRVYRTLNRLESRLPTSAEAWYDRAVPGLKHLAALQTNFVQHGRLHGYLVTVFVVMIGLIAMAFVHGQVMPSPGSLTGIPFYVWSAVLLVLAGTAITVGTRSRLTSLIALGAVGIGVAILFVSHGAVDVALTQLLCDILFVVLLAVALLKLPRFRELRHRRGFFRGLTAVIAITFGTLVSLILMEIVATPLDLRLTRFFEAGSYVEAHGRNIVNVILVDFRALDTLGEIAVVLMAGLAAFALIKLRPGRPANDKDGMP